MFEGDQFHQFIASRTSLPIPLSFPPIHVSSIPTTAATTATVAAASFTPSFDLYNTSSTSHHLQVQQPNFFHALHQNPPTTKNEDKVHNSVVGGTANFEIEKETSMHQQSIVDPWSHEEVLALLRIRSSMENWFPESTWEHVSRRLSELGFKRTAEKCKEKFEEESRYFDNINYSKIYRVFGELEDSYNNNNGGDDNKKNNNKMEKVAKEDEEKDKNMEEAEDSRIDQNPIEENDDNHNHKHGKEVEKSKNKKIRKRKNEKFEMFKGFCEDIISKIMVQQEEMHNKLLEDMVKRDEEKIAREEAWKKQEMDRFNKELEIRAQEQALVGDRQEKIINFLKKCSSLSNSTETLENPISNQISKPEIPISTTIALGNQNKILVPQNPNNSSSTMAQPPQNPNSLNTQIKPSIPISISTEIVRKKTSSYEKEDLGKRWPKDEVLALINLRSSHCNNNEEKETMAKAPLWERISQGMLQMGYKRSAKRCKEKWENINKYFRKTKDANKKRSVDSRTCPYFQKLSTLYNQGTLVLTPSDTRPVEASPENQNQSSAPAAAASGLIISSSQNGSSNSTMHVGEKNDVDFEF